MQFRFFLPVVCAALISCLGCGNDRPACVPVSGQVLIDGEPLEYGTVQVIPENGRAAQGKIGENGRFQLTTTYLDEKKEGCLPGNHQVTVIANESIDAQSQRWHAPKEYADPTTSDLTIEVTEPTDSAKIELTWDGGEPFVEKFASE